jgi:FMN reductase
MNVVGLSGAVVRSSKAKQLVEFVLKQITTPLSHNKACIDMVDLLPELGVTFSRAAAPPRLEKTLRWIENANLLVIGTPIYNGSYTGFLKHLLDLVRPAESDDLEKVAIIAAIDRGDCNSLALDHSLRPLLNQLGYRPVPTSIYARDDDFVHDYLAEETVMFRARRALGEAFRLLGLEPPHSAFLATFGLLRSANAK